MKIITNLSADVYDSHVADAIFAKQYDADSRFLKVTVTNDGRKLHIAKTSKALLNAKRADGESKSFEGNVNDDGTVTVPLAYWMLELDSKVKCDISVIDSEMQKLTTASFEIDVQAVANPAENIAEGKDYDILVSLISECEEAISKAENLNDGYTPIKGVDYWTAEDKAEIMGEKLTPKFVSSISEMSDKGAAYVLLESCVTYENLFDVSAAKLNTRFNSSGSETSHNGVAIINSLPFKNGDVLRINKPEVFDYTSTRIVFNYATGTKALFSGAATHYMPVSVTDTCAEIEIGKLYNTAGDPESGVGETAYKIESIDVAVCIKEGTAITEDDIFDIVITKNEEITEPLPGGYIYIYGDEDGWHSTGMAYTPADYQDRIIALEEAKTVNEGRISVLESMAGEETRGGVPAYWQTAVDALSDKIEEKQAHGQNCFQFVWFSDMHGKNGYVNSNGAGQSSQTYLGAVCQKLCEQYNIPFVAVSGDIMSQSSYTEEASVHAEYADCNKILSAIDADRLLATVGNHDGAWGAPVDGVYYLKDIGNEALYNKVFRRQSTDSRRVFGEDGTYFYVDSFPHKVRFIMLNTHTDGDGANNENGYAVYNSMKNSVLGTKQLHWLENTALDVPDGWNIILMGHYPLKTWSETENSLVFAIKDGELFKEIVDSYNNRTVYSGGSAELENEYWGDGISEYGTSTATEKDFSDAKGRIVAYFHGHLHRDNIDSTGFETCPCIAITTAGGDVRDETVYLRTPGTDTETAIDVVTVDRKDGKIYMTRLGVGEDRETEY